MVTPAGVTQVQVESGAKSALASHFGLTAKEAARAKVNATESRRLGADASPRRLAGTWSVAFEFTVAAEKAAAVEAKTAALASDPAAAKAALAPLLIAGLKKAGVAANLADKMTVTGVVATATKVIVIASTTGTGTTTGYTDGAYQGVASMVVIIAIKMLLWGM